jgi:proline iminopeptidase
VPYQQVCTPLYNTRPAADPLARGRTVFNNEILFASASGEQRTMNLLPGLARVQCPVLVMAGEADPVTPLADAQEIAAAIPVRWGRLVTFAHAGHGAWRDEPEAAMRTLREFIAA